MEEALRIVSFPGLGLKLNVDRVAFNIGSLPIYWYGIIIATGFILGILYCSKRSHEFGVNADRLIDVILIGSLGGILGARIYYVAFQWEYYSRNLDLIFNTRSGGMAIYGGIIGALIAGALMCKLRRVRVLPTADLMSMGFLIGQSVGRWGNFVNIEAFGSNTSLPWGMSAAPIKEYLTQNEAQLEALGMQIDPNMPVHPTFLYESIWCAIGFVLLALYVKHRKFDGEMTLFYLAWYGAGRVVIEGLRTDSLIIPGTNLRISQVLAGVLVVAAVAIWILIRSKQSKSTSNSEETKIRLYSETEEAALAVSGELYSKNKKTDPQETAQMQEDSEGGTGETISQLQGEETAEENVSLREESSSTPEDENK